MSRGPISPEQATLAQLLVYSSASAPDGDAQRVERNGKGQYGAQATGLSKREAAPLLGLRGDPKYAKLERILYLCRRVRSPSAVRIVIS